MTVSDANAIAECVEHGIAADRKQAAALALQAGVDMDMTSDCYDQNLMQLIEEGTLSEEVLDQAVADILRIKMELGLFDYPYRTDTKKEAETILKPEFRKTARKAAQESQVLLKNEGILPFKEGSRLAIVGKLADTRGEMTGTWAVKAVADDCVSIVDACKEQNISYQYFTEEDVLQCENIRELLGASDVILAAVGEWKSQSGEAASRADISLSGTHQSVLRKLLTAERPMAAVLFNGRPLAIPWMEAEVPAILEAWHPGVEAGSAILDILFGKVNPSGKLTATFPQHSGQCPCYYDHINTGRPAGKSKFTSKYLDIPTEPVYPFGFGLSYTTYEYANMKAEEQEKRIRISVDVKNSGAVEGTEIVQCYMHDPVALRVRPVKKLIDFARVLLKPGESRTVTFWIEKEKLGYYDARMHYIVEDGIYEFYVGGNSRDCMKQAVNLQSGLAEDEK